jgi:hypothetical protein
MRREALRDHQKLCVQGLGRWRDVRFAVAVGAQRDAVPNSVALLHAEDVVHIEKAGIGPGLPA